jgi:hypothetical protein
VVTASGSARRRSNMLLVRLDIVGMMRSFEALDIPETCLEDRANEVGETNTHIHMSNRMKSTGKGTYKAMKAKASNVLFKLHLFTREGERSAQSPYS